MNPKGIFFGIDGATWSVMGPMAERGELPNIRRMMEQGASGPMTSTLPPQTVPAWGTVVSGMNPGRLGIYHFLSDSHRDYDQGRPVGADDTGVKFLWQYLSESGRRSIVVTTPLGFPPGSPDTLAVSPIRNPELYGEDVISTSPPELKAELEEALGLRMADLVQQKMAVEQGKATAGEAASDAHLDRLVRFNTIGIDMVRRGTLHLMRNHPWDFLMVVFSSIDGVQHHFWAYMDPQHPAHDPRLARRYGGVIRDMYRQVDAALGEVMDEAGEDVNLMIMSDHGFGPIHRYFYVNRWLEEQGLLSRNGVAPAYREWRKVPLGRGLARIGLGPLARVLGPAGRIPVPVPRPRQRAMVDLVDWKRTRAYATSYAINVNLAGREPQGSVPAAEYDEVVARIKEALLALTDPVSGERIVEAVFEKSEIYEGDAVAAAPDILYVFREPWYYAKKQIGPRASFGDVRTEDGISAHHVNSVQGWKDGIFLARGPGIRSGLRTGQVDIKSLTPTMLYLLGEPVPEDMDGAILEDIVDPALLASRPPRRESRSVRRGETGPAEVSAEEEEKIKESLRKLGYLG